MQQESSATWKSARVRQPSTKSFSPTYLLSSSSLAEYFLSTSALAVSCSLLKNSPRTAPLTSRKMERKLSMRALSCRSLPSSSACPQRLMMQRLMADDSVMLNSPSMRQGRLGKLRPRLTLSSLNQLSPLVQWWSSKSMPEQDSSSLGICPSPRMPQQASLTFTLGERAAEGGKKGPLSASAREQQALISGSDSKLCLILHQKAQLLFSLGYSVSKQQRCSASRKSARVKYPRANSLSPTKALIASILGLAFSRMSIFRFSQSLFQKSPLMSLKASVSTPRMLLSWPASWTFLPSRSVFPERLMMQRAMAVDSVSLKSPSMRQGRLGNSKPRLSLSSLNHLSGLSYCTSSKSRPVQLSSSLRGWPSPRTFQQPNLILLILIYKISFADRIKASHQKLQFYRAYPPSLLRPPAP